MTTTPPATGAYESPSQGAMAYAREEAGSAYTDKGEHLAQGWDAGYEQGMLDERQMMVDAGFSTARCRVTEHGGVWSEVQAERERAHAKHGDTSMEALPITDLTRLTVLMEEVGEVAREFNEARHRAHRLGWDQADAFGPVELVRLRAELIQVAAMAGAWADACMTQKGD